MDPQTLDAAFRDLLDVEPLGGDLFRSRRHEYTFSRVLFGGGVMAQCLMSATATLADARPAHSLHGYFLRAGDAHAPVDYQVERVRDGASFSIRRVRASQDGKAIFDMECSFHKGEAGMFEHGHPLPPGLPMPEDLPELAPYAAGLEAATGGALMARLGSFRLIDARFVDPERWLRGAAPVGERGCWIRLRSQLASDPAGHLAALAYLSDYWLASSFTVGRPYMEVFEAGQIASLDHAMWFHAPARADDWLYYDTDSPASQGGRGLNRGRMFDRSGRLVASFCQESLVRAARVG